MLYKSVHGWDDPAKDRRKAAAQPAHRCTHSLGAALYTCALVSQIITFLTRYLHTSGFSLGK